MHADSEGVALRCAGDRQAAIGVTSCGGTCLGGSVLPCLFENPVFTHDLGTLTECSSGALYAVRIIFPSNSEGL